MTSPYHHHLLVLTVAHNVSILQEKVILSVLLLTQVLLTYFQLTGEEIGVSLWLSYQGPHSYSFLCCKYKKNSHAQDPWSNFFLCRMFSLNTWHGRWPGKKHHAATAIPSSNKGPWMTNEGLRWVTGRHFAHNFHCKNRSKILPHPCSSSFRTVLRPCYSRCTPQHQYHLGNCRNAESRDTLQSS